MNIRIIYCNISIIYCNTSIIYCNTSIIYCNISIIYCNISIIYCSDEYTMKQLYPSHHKELTFSSVRELVRYYRSGDFKYLKLTSQLSPLPRGQSI